MTEPNVFGKGAGKDEGRAGVPQVSHAPQLRGEGLIKVQGRASKLWAAQNPGKRNAVSNSSNHVPWLALIPARWGGINQVLPFKPQPSGSARPACRWVPALSAWAVLAAGSCDLPLPPCWPVLPALPAACPAAALGSCLCWLLPRFSGTSFLNGSDVSTLQDTVPSVKQADFSGLNCWHRPEIVVPTRCKKTPTNPTPQNPINNQNPVRILSPGINVIHSFGGCVDAPLNFLGEIPFYFTKS